MGIYEPIETGSRSQRTFTFAARVLGALKLDGPLLIGLGLITLYGFVILYSASGQSWNRVADAAIRAALGGFAMCALAQVKPAFLRRWSDPNHGSPILCRVRFASRASAGATKHQGLNTAIIPGVRLQVLF